MVRIIVTSRRVEGLSDDKQKLAAYETLVSVKNSLHNLRDYHEFEHCQKVEILVQVNAYFMQARIPLKLKSVILAFLQSGHTKQDMGYDCYAFANSYQGIEQHAKCILFKYWRLRRINTGKPNIGDIVFFMDDMRKLFMHAAIYIGHEYYVSVYNAGGDLHFASFKDMQKSFKGEDVYFASPRT